MATRSKKNLFFKKLLKRLLFAFSRLSESSLFKKILLGIVAVILFFFGCVYAKSSFVSYIENNITVSESEIIRRVKTHTAVPNEDPLSMVRVQDADTLRAQNSFYKDVKEGDYVIVYSTEAIIYNLRDDKIVAEKTKTGQ